MNVCEWFHQFSFRFLWGLKGTWKRVSGFVAFAMKSVSVKLYVPVPICSLGCKSFGYLQAMLEV